jgi:riboflavin synthase
MFTGIIQAIGRVTAIHRHGGDAAFRFTGESLDLQNVQPGDSIAVNGVCLTAIDPDRSGFSADLSGETLSRTTLGRLNVNDRVNLELALTPSSRLGGHLVSGHVDGIGTVQERHPEARSVRFRIKAPEPLAKYIAEKGSICVDGVSLTVNGVQGAVFDLNIVPHTLQVTTLNGLQVGHTVNLEVDQIARYLERLLQGEAAAQPGTPITHSFLAEHGYLKR